MILFFYGQDSYRSHQKLQELKRKYVDASLGDTNLVELDVAKCSVDQLASTLLALPFIASSRLVILNRLLSHGSKLIQEKFFELLEKVPDTTVAVVYEAGVPDRRSKLFKALIKHAKAQEFKQLTGAQLATWMQQQLEPYGTTIDRAAAAQLEAMTDGDTWRLAMELAKLGTTVADQTTPTITRDLVASLVRDTQSTNIFALGDGLATRDPAQAFGKLRSLIDQGESPQHLIALVANTIRTLALVRDALDRDHTSKHDIASYTKLKPFVVSKHLAAAKQLSFNQLADMMQQLGRIDVDSKRGRIDAEVGLELFVVHATANI